MATRVVSVPGGMGIPMVPEAAQLKEVFMRTWPETKPYFTRRGELR